MTYYPGPAYDTEILLTDVEQPKHLLTYDLGLAETDATWHSRLMTFANMRVIKKYAHQATESRITAPRKVARKECRVYAQQTGPQRSPEGKTRQSSTFASRHSEIWILDIRAEKDLRAEIPAEIAPLPDNHLGFLHLYRRTSGPARSSGYRRGSTPPWRERDRAEKTALGDSPKTPNPESNR